MTGRTPGLADRAGAKPTNDRTDAWGGTAEKRMRFPLEVVRRTRELVGAELPIVYRQARGLTRQEAVRLAKAWG